MRAMEREKETNSVFHTKTVIVAEENNGGAKRKNREGFGGGYSTLRTIASLSDVESQTSERLR